jgi:hypothetical protein
VGGASSAVAFVEGRDADEGGGAHGAVLEEALVELVSEAAPFLATSRE